MNVPGCVPKTSEMALILFLYLATVILAREDDVISLFIPDADPQPMVASIIAQVGPIRC